MKFSKPFVILFRMAYIAFFVICVAIAVPSFVKKSKTVRAGNPCINHLRIIASAKESWAMAEGKHMGDAVVVKEVNHYIKGDTTPLCPAGGVYAYNPVGTDPTCTIRSPTLHALPQWTPQPDGANKTLEATSQ